MRRREIDYRTRIQAIDSNVKTVDHHRAIHERSYKEKLSTLLPRYLAVAERYQASTNLDDPEVSTLNSDLMRSYGEGRYLQSMYAIGKLAVHSLVRSVDRFEARQGKYRGRQASEDAMYKYGAGVVQRGGRREWIEMERERGRAGAGRWVRENEPTVSSFEERLGNSYREYDGRETGRDSERKTQMEEKELNDFYKLSDSKTIIKEVEQKDERRLPKKVQLGIGSKLTDISKTTKTNKIGDFLQPNENKPRKNHSLIPIEVTPLHSKKPLISNFDSSPAPPANPIPRSPAPHPSEPPSPAINHQSPPIAAEWSTASVNDDRNEISIFNANDDDISNNKPVNRSNTSPESATKNPIHGSKNPTQGTQKQTYDTTNPIQSTKNSSQGTKNRSQGTEKQTFGEEIPNQGTKNPTQGSKNPSQGTNSSSNRSDSKNNSPSPSKKKARLKPPLPTFIKSSSLPTKNDRNEKLMSFDDCGGKVQDEVQYKPVFKVHEVKNMNDRLKSKSMSPKERVKRKFELSPNTKADLHRLQKHKRALSADNSLRLVKHNEEGPTFEESMSPVLKPLKNLKNSRSLQIDPTNESPRHEIPLLTPPTAILSPKDRHVQVLKERIKSLNLTPPRQTNPINPMVATAMNPGASLNPGTAANPWTTTNPRTAINPGIAANPRVTMNPGTAANPTSPIKRPQNPGAPVTPKTPLPQTTTKQPANNIINSHQSSSNIQILDMSLTIDDDNDVYRESTCHAMIAMRRSVLTAIPEERYDACIDDDHGKVRHRNEKDSRTKRSASYSERRKKPVRSRRGSLNLEKPGIVKKKVEFFKEVKQNVVPVRYSEKLRLKLLEKKDVGPSVRIRNLVRSIKEQVEDKQRDCDNTLRESYAEMSRSRSRSRHSIADESLFCTYTVADFSFHRSKIGKSVHKWRDGASTDSL